MVTQTRLIVMLYTDCQAKAADRTEHQA